MMDSLPYRNDAAIVFRRLIRSLPTRARRDRRRDLRQGPAGDDDGAGRRSATCPVIIVPGGVTLPPTDGEDAGKVQTIGARFAHGEITLEEAAELGCRACASPGGGCQFLGTAATAQVVAEALGLALPHSALAPSGQPVWLDMARALGAGAAGPARGAACGAQTSSPTPRIRNAMVVHAAFGGSTNLLLHIPAIAHAAGLRAADRRRLDARQPPRAAPRRACCRTARSIIRRCACSWPAACPR